MIIIGVDPHKSSHTATAVDPATGQPVASITVPASTVGYRRLWRWAARFDQRRWAIENARGLGRHLAQWLVHRNEHVVDVPATATTRVRELSRGGRRKNDTIDASAAACVAALHGDATVVAVEDHTDVFAVLEERRANLAAQRVRLVNQLHAQLRDLVGGGAPTDLTATTAAALLRRLRPPTAADQARRDVARDVRQVDKRLATITASMTDALEQTATSLTDIDGIGPVLASRLIGRTRRASRFPDESAYASYTGAAPVEVASGPRARHRLSRSGDRQLN